MDTDCEIDGIYRRLTGLRAEFRKLRVSLVQVEGVAREQLAALLELSRAAEALEPNSPEADGPEWCRLRRALGTANAVLAADQRARLEQRTVAQIVAIEKAHERAAGSGLHFGPAKKACYCDLEPGQYPDGCVLDGGFDVTGHSIVEDDCIHAEKIKLAGGKEHCEYWHDGSGPR